MQKIGEIRKNSLASKLHKHMRDNPTHHYSVRDVERLFRVSRVTAQRAIQTLAYSQLIHQVMEKYTPHGGYYYTIGKADLTASEYRIETDDENTFYFLGQVETREDILTKIQEFMEANNTGPIASSILPVIKISLSDGLPDAALDNIITGLKQFVQTFESIRTKQTS